MKTDNKNKTTTVAELAQAVRDIAEKHDIACTVDTDAEKNAVRVDFSEAVEPEMDYRRLCEVYRIEIADGRWEDEPTHTDDVGCEVDSEGRDYDDYLDAVEDGEIDDAIADGDESEFYSDDVDNWLDDSALIIMSRLPEDCYVRTNLPTFIEFVTGRDYPYLEVVIHA